MFFISYIREGVENYLFILPLYIVLEVIIYSYCRRQRVTVSKGHLFGFQMLACLLTCMFSVTGSAGINDIGSYGDEIIHPDKINLIPFFNWEIGDLYGFIMNIILFIPLGILLPVLFYQGTSFFKTVRSGFLLSLLIELSQLFNMRATDIDDLITNTAGTAAGFLLYTLIFRRLTLFQLKNTGYNNRFIKHIALWSVLLIFAVYFLAGNYIIRRIWGAISRF